MRLDEKESILSATPSQNVVLWSLVLNSMIVLSLIYSLLLMTRWKILVPFHCNGHDDVCSLSPLYRATQD